MFHRKNIFSKLTLLFVLAFSASSLFSQSPTSSPYSRFGLGEIEKKGFAQTMALGGTYIGMINDSVAPFFINSGNPASYSSVRLTTFEVGAQGTYNTFYSNSLAVKKNNVGLKYLSLAFPINRRSGGAFGITPYSNIGYSVTDQKAVDNIGTVKEQYEGSGGANQLFLGYGVKPFNNFERKFIKRSRIELDSLRKRDTYYANCSTLADSLSRESHYKAKQRRMRYVNKTLSNISLGANGYYLFGNMNHTSRLIYPSGAGIYNTKRSVDTQIHDFSANAGAQLSFDIDSIGKRSLKKHVRLTFGYNIALPSSMRAVASTVATTFIYGPFQREYIQDTVLNNSNVGGRIKLPLIHGVGFCFKRGDNLTIAGDMEMQLWSGYKFFDETNAFKNSNRYSMGIQYVPNRQAIGDFSYFKRVQYRVGARYSDGYIELNNTKINEYAVSAGLGLPVGRPYGRKRIFRTIVNFSVEYGQSGTQQYNLVQQKFIRGIIGFTFNDEWFIKSRYD